MAKKRKLPVNAPIGTVKTITVVNPKSGKRKVTFERMKKKGWGKWRIKKNVAAGPKSKKKPAKRKSKSKKKPVHGIAKAKQLNAKRSPKAKAADKAKSSKHTYRKANEANIQKWSSDPRRSDMKSVDTKQKK